jgi:hypothetical protein
VKTGKLAALPLVGALALAACNTGPTGASPSPTTEPSRPPPVEPSATSTTAPPSAALPTAPLRAASVAHAKGITRVRAESRLGPAADALPLVTLSKAELLVGTTAVAKVEPGPLGFDGSIKREGKRAALEVLPIEAALRPSHDGNPSESTVRVLIDAESSYRTALEVLFSAAQAGFTSFDLLVSSTSGERVVPASTPSREERRALRQPGAPPVMAFLVQADGVSVTVGSVTIGKGCVKGGTGTTIPLHDGKLDTASLATCAARLTGMDATWARSTVAEVTAAPDTEMQAVLAAVAAVQKTFPVVHFGLQS